MIFKTELSQNIYMYIFEQVIFLFLIYIVTYSLFTILKIIILYECILNEPNIFLNT